MGYPISRSNITVPLTFTLVLSSDHITGATGKTPTVTISKNGGAFITPQGAVTEIGNGSYQVAANAFDSNTLGPILLNATATACDPTDETFIVVDYNPNQFTPVSAATGQGAISATDIINEALTIIGVKGQGSSLTANQMQQSFRRLNLILAGWSLMPLTIPAIGREVFPLEAGRGGPSDTLTIGPGGDFDTSRPASIDSVGLLVTSVAQPFEIVRSLYTDAAYQSITQKELQSTYFAGLYFNPTYASGLASINLYPVPSDDTTSLVLYRGMQLSQFANLTATYDLPPGAVDALEYELARRSQKPFGRPIDPDVEREAAMLLANYQRANTKMVDLGMDPALTAQAGVYNILSDSMNSTTGR